MERGRFLTVILEHLAKTRVGVHPWILEAEMVYFLPKMMENNLPANSHTFAERVPKCQGLVDVPDTTSMKYQMLLDGSLSPTRPSWVDWRDALHGSPVLASLMKNCDE